MKTRNLIWQIPLLVVVTGPLWWQMAARMLDPHSQLKFPDRIPEKKIVMDGVTITQEGNGHKEFVAQLAHLSSRNNQKTYLMDGVKGELITPEQRVQVSGGEAIFDADQQILTLLDNVRLVTDNGMQFETPVLRYLVRYKMVKSAAPLLGTSANMKISGTSFSYQMRTGDFRLGGRVVCQLWQDGDRE